MLFGKDQRPPAGRRALRRNSVKSFQLLCEQLEDRTLPAIMQPTFELFDPPGEIKPDAGTASPSGITPAVMRQSYGVNLAAFGSVTGNGSGQTIAIIDAYDQPNLAGDLAAFDQQYGLPAPPSFTKINENGGTTLPGSAPKGDWGIEISLDVEWSHVIAPMANILLVEANSASDSDLWAAVDTARNYAGVSVVSMSFAGDEASSDSAFDTHFTTPAGHNGVTFIASSGDNGAYSDTGSNTKIVGYPAVSPNVVSVGGTTLSANADGSYSSEVGWGDGTSSGTAGGSGGGISQFFAQPAYQSGIVTQSSTFRTVPDVSFDADPNSGVPVYDSYDESSSKPWIQVGGTSLAAPMWAGVIAIADQGRVLNGLGTLDGPSTTLPKLYALPASDFHDVLTGNNGYAAGAGYDLVTGLGSPNVNLVVSALAVNVPTIGSFAVNPVAVQAGTTVTLTASNVGEINGSVAGVNFYLESNGTPGLQIGSDTLLGAGTQNGTSWTFAASTTGLAAGTYTYYAVAVDSNNVGSVVASATLAVGSRVYADTRWQGLANGTAVDCDPLEPGVVSGIIGTNAFASVNAAIAAAPAGTTVVVNGASSGSYGNFSEAVSISTAIVLVIQYGPVTFTSLTDSASGSTILLGGETLTIGGTTATQIAGILVGSGGLTKVGTGTLTLSGANLYTGITTVSGGTLSVSSLASGGSASPVGASTNAVGNLVLQGGSTLLYTGASSSSDRGFTIGTGGAMVDVATGGATLNLGGNIANGANNLTVTGTGNATFGGIFTGTPATATLTKGVAAGDTGTLTFTAADALDTGAISVADGVLVIATTSLSSTRVLTIAAGAAVDSSGTLALLANSASSTTEVTGAGTLNLTSPSNGPTSPDIYFNPNDIDNTLTTYGTKIAAPINLGSAQRYIYGKSNGDNFVQYGGDGILNGAINGSGGLTFIGQDTYVSGSNEMDVAFVLAGTNTFGGELEIQRGSIYLNSASALTQGSALLMDPASGNNARLFLWGHAAIVSNLASSGAGAVVIANGNRPSGSSPVTLAAATLTVTQSSPTTFGGLIADNFLEVTSTGTHTVGGVSLVEQGTSSLMLTGANTYSGTTTVSGGTLVAGVNVPSGAAGAFGSNTTSLSLTGGSLLAANGVTVSRAIAVGSGASASLGAVTGASATFAGAIVLDPDTLTLTAPAGQTVTITGGISGAGSSNAVIAAGPGTILLAGTASTYAGSTSVTGGTLQDGLNNAVPTGTALSVNGGTFDVNGHNQTVASLAMVGGTVETEAGTLTLGGNITGQATAGDSPALIAGKLDLGGTTRTLTVTHGGDANDNDDLDIAAVISDGGINVVNGTGSTAFLEFSGTSANTYTGTTTVSSGTLLLDGPESGNDTIAGPLAIGGGSGTAAVQLLADDQIATSTTVTIGTGGTLDLNGFDETIGPLVLSNGTIGTADVNDDLGILTLNADVSANGTSTTSSISGLLALGTGTRTFNVSSGDNLNVAASITSASDNLTLAGSGTMTLSGGNNSYTGGTYITGGTLAITGGNAIPDASQVTLSTGVTFDVKSSETIGSFTGAGTVDLDGSSVMLTTGADGTYNPSFGGLIEGAGGLTKIGLGYLYITASNTYTGPTIIQNGFVFPQANAAFGLGSAGITVEAGGTLDIYTPVDYTTPEPLILDSTGVGNTGQGGFLGHGFTFAGNITLGANAVIRSSSAPFTLSGQINLQGHQLQINATGGPTSTVILTNAISSSPRGGSLLVSAGTLQLDGSATGIQVTVASGATLSGVGTVGAITADGTVSPGDGGSPSGVVTLTATSANFASGGSLSVAITGNSTAPASTQLSLGSGTLTLGGTSTLAVNLSGLSYAANAGSTINYTIVSAGAVSGVFNSTSFSNQGSFTPTVNYSTSVVVQIGNVASSWASDAEVPAGIQPDAAAAPGQAVTVAVLDTGIDFNNPALLPNIWINQAEIPASVRPNLVDVDHDGYISFLDLQNPINQGPGKVEDVYHDGYISVRDLLAPLAEGGWATGKIDPTDGLVDDIVGWNFVDNNNDPYDQSGHGTYSASLVTEIDPSALIMPLEILDASGLGTLSAATAALHYATAHGAQVVLNAWVPDVLTPAWTGAVASAEANGELVVMAAGNNSASALGNLAQMHLSNVVIVGAVDASDNLASFSNSSAGTVDLAALGVGVMGMVQDGQFQARSGTSVSAALVAGDAALAWGLHPTLDDQDIVWSLEAGADEVPGLDAGITQGRVLNFDGTLAAAAQLVPIVPAATAVGSATSQVLAVANLPASSDGSSGSPVNPPTNAVFPGADVPAQPATGTPVQAAAASPTELPSPGPLLPTSNPGWIGLANPVGAIAVDIPLPATFGPANLEVGMDIGAAVDQEIAG